MARSARHTPARRRVARIDTCQAEFDVAAPRGPFSAPETLLTTIRQELLPALSEVLDAPEWEHVHIDAPLIEIDLGDWPEEPTWSDVRYVLALKLRQALSAYATLEQGGDTRHDLKLRSAYDAVKYVADGSAGTSASANTAQPLTGDSEDEPRADGQNVKPSEGSTLRDPQRALYDLTHDGAEEPAGTSPPTNAALPLTGEPDSNAQAGSPSTKQSKPALPTEQR